MLFGVLGNMYGNAKILVNELVEHDVFLRACVYVFATNKLRAERSTDSDQSD